MPKRELLTTRTPILLHYRLHIKRTNGNERQEPQDENSKTDEPERQGSAYAAVAKSLVPEHKAIVTEIYYENVVKSQMGLTEVYFRVEPKPGMTLQKTWRTLTIDGVQPACINGKTVLRDKLLFLQRSLDFQREILAPAQHQAQISHPEARAIAQGSGGAAALLDDFLATSEGPVASIAKAFREGILGNQLRRLSDPVTISAMSRFGSDSGQSTPKVFLVDDCWLTAPCEQTLEGMVMANISRGEIRRRGEAHVILGDQRYCVISDVLRCLHHSDPQGTPYIFNIPLEKVCSYAMRIPEELRISQGQIREDNNALSAVLSPQFSFTDLHIGKEIIHRRPRSCMLIPPIDA